MTTVAQKKTESRACTDCKVDLPTRGRIPRCKACRAIKSDAERRLRQERQHAAIVLGVQAAIMEAFAEQNWEIVAWLALRLESGQYRLDVHHEAKQARWLRVCIETYIGGPLGGEDDLIPFPRCPNCGDLLEDCLGQCPREPSR